MLCACLHFQSAFSVPSILIFLLAAVVALAYPQSILQLCSMLKAHLTYALAVYMQDAQDLFMADMSKTAVTQKILALQNAAGIRTPLVNPRASGIQSLTVTGWCALAAVTALMTLSFGLSYFVYRRCVSSDQSYMMVSKSGDV